MLPSQHSRQVPHRSVTDTGLQGNHSWPWMTVWKVKGQLSWKDSKAPTTLCPQEVTEFPARPSPKLKTFEKLNTLNPHLHCFRVSIFWTKPVWFYFEVLPISRRRHQVTLTLNRSRKPVPANQNTTSDRHWCRCRGKPSRTDESASLRRERRRLPDGLRTIDCSSRLLRVSDREALKRLGLSAGSASLSETSEGPAHNREVTSGTESGVRRRLLARTQPTPTATSHDALRHVVPSCHYSCLASC